MIPYELFQNEGRPAYRDLSAGNLARQYDFPIPAAVGPRPVTRRPAPAA